ncbi:MAG: hypothetical protein IM504_14845 [Microcystis sp. M038S2]|uniref:DUF6888 family protein n=1 Tax=unclassified Microcystis TaxID=2643300 RepID=UPI00118F69BC|nr:MULTISPECIES: hypothetical protein [unclassified Microcystis]NCR21735.1 hypothetical protein [Microcystis aeruginosa L111-01]NCR69171.1 hypothetical protein [Microcystis aeruginosa LL11-07]NCS22780.1 hypothetical protein [Microcystis aeruginosa G11-06]TRU61036.1 MAG: hypothetical protein EWV56_09915 [Microcystis aeruginosa Ma_QC_C_20070823_S13D]TRU66847.1 MAG: hypothetical protein EWV48_01710 [Microcystis aeruginosa Ma_QC_C_20070823_S13]
MPTQKQKDTSIFICQLLSNLYQPIYLFHYDSRLKIIYILAGTNEDISILIDEQGNWNFEL